MSVAVIVASSAVVEALITTLYVPLWLFTTCPMSSPGSLEEKKTASELSRCPWASFTVAVAVVVELPFATIEVGFSATVTLATGPAVWVRTASPETAGVLVLSVALIVAVPTVVELVIVAVYLPPPALVVALIFSPGSLDLKATFVSFANSAPLGPLMVAVAVVTELPSAMIVVGESVTVTEAAGAAWAVPVSAPQLITAATTSGQIRNRRRARPAERADACIRCLISTTTPPLERLGRTPHASSLSVLFLREVACIDRVAHLGAKSAVRGDYLSVMKELCLEALSAAGSIAVCGGWHGVS